MTPRKIRVRHSKNYPIEELLQDLVDQYSKAGLVKKTALILGGYRRKKGPVLTWGRVKHAIWGVAIKLGVSALGGPAGLGILAAWGAGHAWEMATPWLALKFKWKWPYPDAIDEAAFPAGSAVTVGIEALIRLIF